MIDFTVMLKRLLVESFVVAEAAEESDNFLVNNKFVVPESRLHIRREVTLFIITFERFFRIIFILLPTLSSFHI